MRLGTNRIRLCLVDEPTAAMDPVGEAELFDQLRAAAKTNNITMIMVSHRFGSLTRYADTILYVLEFVDLSQLTSEAGHTGV